MFYLKRNLRSIQQILTVTPVRIKKASAPLDFIDPSTKYSNETQSWLSGVNLSHNKFYFQSVMFLSKIKIT